MKKILLIFLLLTTRSLYSIECTKLLNFILYPQIQTHWYHKSLYLEIPQETIELQNLVNEIANGTHQTNHTVAKILEDKKGEDIPFYQILPKKLQSLSTLKLQEGPNCHNAGLLWHNIMDEVREVTSKELQRLLKINFQKISPTDQLRIGDLILFRLGPDDTVFHTAVYINKNTVWNKMGYWHSDPYEFNTFNYLIKEYENYTVVEYYRLIE